MYAYYTAYLRIYDSATNLIHFLMFVQIALSRAFAWYLSAKNWIGSFKAWKSLPFFWWVYHSFTSFSSLLCFL